MSNEVSGQSSSSGLVVGLIVIGVLALASAGVGFLSYVRTGQLSTKLGKAEAKLVELEKRVKQGGGPAAGKAAGKGGTAAAAPAATPPARRKKRPATTTTAATTKPATAPAAVTTPGAK